MGAENAFITKPYGTGAVYVWADQSSSGKAVNIIGSGGSGFAIPVTSTGNTYKLSSSDTITSGNNSGADETLTFTIEDVYYRTYQPPYYRSSQTTTVKVNIPNDTDKEAIPALIKSELDKKILWTGTGKRLTSISRTTGTAHSR